MAVAELTQQDVPWTPHFFSYLEGLEPGQYDDIADDLPTTDDLLEADEIPSEQRPQGASGQAADRGRDRSRSPAGTRLSTRTRPDRTIRRTIPGGFGSSGNENGALPEQNLSQKRLPDVG